VSEQPSDKLRELLVAVPIDPMGPIKYAVLKRVGDMLTHTVGGESDRIFGAEEVTTRKTPEVIATTYGNAYKVKIDALARLGDLLSETPKNAGAREIGKAGVPRENPALSELGLAKTSMGAQQPQAECILTPRQRDILRLVSIGHTNREISEVLAISVRTVEVHRFNLMRRLNVRNVAHLFSRSIELGLIDDKGEVL
jgi:DNA-binding CsgD family transcriptional regulator